MNKYLPECTGDKKHKKQMLGQAWEEIKATFRKNMAEGALPDGIEMMYTVGT